MKKFKAAEFMKDLGLSFGVEVLVDETTNIVYLSHSQVSSEVAIMRVIDNLNATYGKETVTKVLKKLVDE